MDEEIKKLIQGFIDKEEPFTALQISNELKKSGNNIRHRDVNHQIRDLFNYTFSGVYDRSSITVNAEIINDSGQLEKINTQALLYHPFDYDPADYDNRELRAIQTTQQSNIQPNVQQSNIQPTQPVNKDDFYDMSSTTEEITNSDGFISFEQQILKDGIISINSARMNLKNFTENDEFNISVYPECLYFNKANKNGIIKMTERSGNNYFRVKKSMLDMCGLSNYETVWIHLYDEKIILNTFHPIVASWDKYKNKLIKFKVHTPDSDSDEVTQTVVLKVDGFKRSKKGDFLVYGRNLKRLDDKNSIDNTHRQYRFDRIYKDSVEELAI